MACEIVRDHGEMSYERAVLTSDRPYNFHLAVAEFVQSKTPGVLIVHSTPDETPTLETLNVKIIFQTPESSILFNQVVSEGYSNPALMDLSMSARGILEPENINNSGGQRLLALYEHQKGNFYSTTAERIKNESGEEHPNYAEALKRVKEAFERRGSYLAEIGDTDIITDEEFRTLVRQAAEKSYCRLSIS